MFSNTLVCVLAVLEGVGGILGCVLMVAKRDCCTVGCMSKLTGRGLGSWSVARGGDETCGAVLGGMALVGLL